MGLNLNLSIPEHHMFNSIKIRIRFFICNLKIHNIFRSKMITGTELPTA